METLHRVTLSDGLVADVNSKTLKAINALQGLEHELARGVIGSVYAGRVLSKDSDEPGDIGSLLVVFEPEGLGILADDMFKEHKRCFGLQSLWQGNAPGVSRSYRNQ
jgi:hypothetical protein